MKNKDLGAFARPKSGDRALGQEGLTKREYFIAAAMQGLLASTTTEPNYEIIADWAIEQADEILKRLE